MRTPVFVACVLAAVIVSDAQINHDIKETIISKIFDIKELIECHLIFAECVVELGLLKIPRPELPYCIAQKKNLIDKEGGILWDEGVNYLKKVVRDAKAWDEIWDKLLKKCREEYDKFEGSWREKSLKAMECGLPMVGYIIRQKIFFLKI
ncbi:uncharacterized protein LOC143900231 [Temnothorax americanus]|uniref:uncharacterized protein LOC143900231 n=1 Tax=Temnothorax americanus TaxID=1964332 RepID=UPI0040684BAD